MHSSTLIFCFTLLMSNIDATSQIKRSKTNSIFEEIKWTKHSLCSFNSKIIIQWLHMKTINGGKNTEDFYPSEWHKKKKFFSMQQHIFYVLLKHFNLTIVNCENILNKNLTLTQINTDYMEVKVLDTIPRGTGDESEMNTDITRVLGQSYYTFATGLPFPRIRYEAVMGPFEADTWITIAFVLVFVALVATYLVNYRRYKKPESKFKRFFSVLFALFRCLASQNKQTQEVHHMVMISWQLCSLVLLTAYASRLFHILSYPPLSTVPKTWIDLANDHSYRIGTNRYNFTLELLKRQKDFDGKQIEKRLVARNIPVNDCLQFAVHNPNFACIEMDNLLHANIKKSYATKEGDFLIRISEDHFLPVRRVWSFNNRRGKYIDLNKPITSLLEAGFVATWIDHLNRAAFLEGWQKAVQGAHEKSVDLMRSMSMAAMIGLHSKPIPFSMCCIFSSLLLLITGLIIGTVVFLLENLVFRIEKFLANSK